MPLTPDQKQKIITSPDFKLLVNPAKSQTQFSSSSESLFERAQKMKASTAQEKANGVISKLKSNLESKFSKGEIGGTKEEISERLKTQTKGKIEGDLKNTGDKLSEMAKDVVTALPREMLRPFVSFVQGIQGLVPGGKTGNEKVSVPGLGEIKSYTDMTSGEAAVSALNIVPSVGKPAKEVVEQIAKPRIISSSNDKIDELVGRITQGSKYDIDAAKKALKQVETKNVKTFSDLKSVADENISTAAKRQDELFDSLKETYKADSLSVKVGDKQQNFVTKGIEHLKEYYSQTENIAKLDEIEKLEAKLLNEGLSVKEINNLAREYGAEMPSAFSPKTGEPLTAINKVAFENVRKGIKNTSREIMPDDATRVLDEHISDLYVLKRTSENMEKSVLKLQNKIKKRGLLESIGRKTGRAIDVATMGSVRGFLTSFLPSNIGNKVMNSLDIEADLANNLKKIDELNNRIDKMSDEQVVNVISNIINASNVNTNKK